MLLFHTSHPLLPSPHVHKSVLYVCFSTAAAAKSLQSCPTLCDPIDGSPPGSPSLGFSRQEHWSGLPFPSPMHETEYINRSHSLLILNVVKVSVSLLLKPREATHCISFLNLWSTSVIRLQKWTQHRPHSQFTSGYFIWCGSLCKELCFVNSRFPG